MSSRVAVLLSALLFASGCQVTTDLGKQCVLRKKQTKLDAQGNPICVKDSSDQCVMKNDQVVYETEVVNIKERELTSGQDYIAFGATDCEDLICVRDVDSPANPEYDPSNPEKLEASALGYCSRACIQGSDASVCDVTDSSVPDTLKTRMDCRSLLLDQASLDALRASDPEAYRSTFGDTNSPYFCAGKPATKTGS